MHRASKSRFFLVTSHEYRDIVIDSDKGIFTTDVELNGVSSSLVDLVGDEKVFDRTCP